MRIALGSDHGGFELKQEIIKYLEEKKIEYKDCMEPGVLGSFSWQTLFLLTIYCII